MFDGVARSADLRPLKARSAERKGFHRYVPKYVAFTLRITHTCVRRMERGPKSKTALSAVLHPSASPTDFSGRPAFVSPCLLTSCLVQQPSTLVIRCAGSCILPYRPSFEYGRSILFCESPPCFRASVQAFRWRGQDSVDLPGDYGTSPLSGSIPRFSPE